ncbi:MAG: TRAP transporter small permease [Chloroflexi bacterium]|nr:TRAP transporter small permease [Chloroflexota bacterium]
MKKKTTFFSEFGKWHTIAERVLGLYVVNVGIILILTIVVINIVGRYLFAFTLPGSIELVVLIFIVSGLCALAYVQNNKGHVEVEIIREHLPFKAKSIIELFALVISLAFALLVTWRSAVYLLETWADYIPGVIRFPYGPFRLFVPIGFALMSVRIIRQMVDIVTALGKRGRSQA